MWQKKARLSKRTKASLEDLRLLLQKEGVVFSLTSTSCHMIFATIFTPRIAGQKAVNRQSTDDSQTSFIFFMISTIVVYQGRWVEERKDHPFKQTGKVYLVHLL